MPVNFFVSYTGKDEAYAEWIAWILEDAKYTTKLQKWDFASGGNFIEEMQAAATSAERTIAVLSPEYLGAKFPVSEWTAAFKKDPDGQLQKLVPIRIVDFEPPGLFGPIAYIDIVGLHEQEAKKLILERVESGRKKPTTPPEYPGLPAQPRAVPEKPEFPPQARAGSPIGYLPRITRKFSDQEKLSFLRSGFVTTRKYFSDAVATLEGANSHVKSDINENSATQFCVEIFVDGDSRNRCCIWIEDEAIGRNSICYSEGQSVSAGNAFNEVISVGDDRHEQFFEALMANASFRQIELDPKKMTADQAAEYLWRRFAQALEH